MLGLHSVAGNTVAELFYNAMGIFSFGMAGLTILLALTLANIIKTAAATTVVSLGTSLGRWDDVKYKECLERLEPVRALATRCPHCGADLLQEEESEQDLALTAGELPAQ